jgi:SAM-dependent methyltransferase
MSGCRIDTKDFWRNPYPDAIDKQHLFDWYKPEFYAKLAKQAGLIVEELEEVLPKDASILELGCGAGRNLAGLKKAGFKNLAGIEINKDAIELGRKTFDLSGISLTCSAIEEADIPEVDCIYTHGVLMHLPPESEFVFETIANKAKSIILTIENEFIDGNLQWPRNYEKVFSPFGWRELYNYSTEKWPPNSIYNILRIFAR